MKYFITFFYNNEGNQQLVIMSSAQQLSDEYYKEHFMNPIHYLEPATFELWDIYESNVDGGWTPSPRQRKMISEMLEKNPEMILQYVPDCTPEEFGKVKHHAEGRTINNLWSHKEYFDLVRANR